MQAATDDQLEILLVIEADIATTALIERVLLACKPAAITYRKQYLRSLQLKDFSSCTIPMFVRIGDPGRDFWVDLLAQAHWPFLYYIDDNFWEIKGQSPLALYYQDAGVRRTLERFVQGASAVLTNSVVLKTYLARYSKAVQCVPAFFDFALIRDVAPYTGPERRIGFAGSASRQDDLTLIAPALEHVLRLHSDVVFEFVGVMPAGVQPGRRVRFFPAMADYAEFVRFQASRGWHIGLAPLLDNESNRSKTNNKFREYGACAIAGLYSRLDPYAEIVPGLTGLLVDHSQDAWVAAIEQLLGQPELARRIGAEARATVLARYSVDVVAAQWAAEFRAVAAAAGRAHRFGERARRQLLHARVAVWVRSLSFRLALAYREGGARGVVAKLFRRVGLR